MCHPVAKILVGEVTGVQFVNFEVFETCNYHLIYFTEYVVLVRSALVLWVAGVCN